MKRAKRMLWCRWFHRWEPARVYGGWTRNCCQACWKHGYGRERMNSESGYHSDRFN